MVELVDATDLKSVGHNGREGSSPSVPKTLQLSHLQSRSCQTLCRKKLSRSRGAALPQLHLGPKRGVGELRSLNR